MTEALEYGLVGVNEGLISTEVSLILPSLLPFFPSFWGGCFFNSEIIKDYDEVNLHESFVLILLLFICI